MGKHKQAKQSNGIGFNNDKTSPRFKLAHMFHVLDYHRWHSVKKVLAHKKHHERKHASESVSKVIVCEDDHCSKIEATENSQFEVQKKNSSLSKENLPSPSSPQYKRSSSMQFSLNKSSRASRIGKMIIKEVTKRKGRHRRSSTCPASSELKRSDLDNQHIEIINEGLVAESNQDKVTRHIMDESNKKCDLCNTMKIECRLGDMKQANKQVDMLLQDISFNAIDKLPFKGKIDKSASFHHSKEFLDAICVLGFKKELALRLSDDPRSSSRNILWTKETITSSKGKFLEKLGTFPFNASLDTKDFSSSAIYRSKANSYIKEKIDTQQNRCENPSNLHGVQTVGRRFKDLRQKIKHLIKENKKEQKRIALDALFHKVPYGYKVSEENVKESPRVSICESDRKSLDESLDKYCQLFETTSIGKEEKKNTQAGGSSLSIVNENSSSRWKEGIFGRIFSSPDLQMFSSHTSQGDGRDISFIKPSRRTISFSERDGGYAFNNNVTNTMHFERVEEMIFEDLNDYHNEESFSSVLIDKEDIIVDQGDNKVEIPKPLRVDFFECNDDIIATHPTMITLGSHPQEMYEPEGILLKDSESPTYSCIKIDEGGGKSPIHCISSSHHHVRVTSYELEEFNFVKDVLEHSGYLGTQLLGTWYSFDQPMNPSIFIELESCSLIEDECSPSNKGKSNSHLLLFDMINEALLNIYERSVTYWSKPLLSCCQMHQMPKGNKVLKEVWDCINWYMCCSKNDRGPYLDYITTRDLAKYDGWMNLQFDAECIGLEIEDFIFEDILNEIIS